MEDNKKNELKEDERMAMMPVIAHDLDMARLERSNERLISIIKWLVAVIVILVAIIGIAVYEFTSCDFTDVVVDSDDGGAANYLQAGNNGVINNAEDNSAKENAQK